MIVKKCSGCKQMLPETDFYKDKYRKYGLSCRCKTCHKQYEIENYEKIKKYRDTHKKDSQQRWIKYKEGHKEYLKQKNKDNFLKEYNYCVESEIENVENYNLAKFDNFKGWHRHHKLETHNSDGDIRLVPITEKELIALDMYYERPASELIWMKIGEHMSLHNKFRSYYATHKDIFLK